MKLTDVTFDVGVPPSTDLLTYYGRLVEERRPADAVPVRFVVNGFPSALQRCSVGFAHGPPGAFAAAPSLFAFRRRPFRRRGPFTVVHVVPTGIGAEIGGHSGDGGPAAQLLGAACDRLILHPNVVNASDINEMPSNAIYVEGSSIARVLMGTLGLRPTRANRVGVLVVEPPGVPLLADDAINGASAAMASGGVPVALLMRLRHGMRMEVAFAADGRATGTVHDFGSVDALIRTHHARFDALAISSPMDFPPEQVDAYFAAGTSSVNPWGGLEALLTHAVSLLHGIPAAHAPLLESFRGRGLVEPSQAAESVSCVDLFCVLKGLHRSPQLVVSPDFNDAGLLSAPDIDCLVLPDRCIGIPTLAAHAQGIPVVVVEDRTNILTNDLDAIRWTDGHLYRARSYEEAAGIVLALREGIAPRALRRPLRRADLVVADGRAPLDVREAHDVQERDGNLVE